METRDNDGMIIIKYSIAFSIEISNIRTKFTI